MKFFVTGHNGYIGSHLVELLKEEGHYVIGCDINLFEECNWEPLIKPDREIIKDIRLLTEKDIEGSDVIVHLAAISNDPMGELDANITYDVNLKGSIHLAALAKKVNVPRFLFSSSCSIYGKAAELDLDENAELNPVSAYAISKIEVEKELLLMNDNNFSSVLLRNSTAYGHSRNFRIDLVVNNLLCCAFARGDIRILSDGTPWRPLIHCKDIARAFIAFAKAPIEDVKGKAVNIGGNSENYQVKDVADLVKKLLPASNIVYTGEVGADPRNYKVKFDLLNKILPDFKLQYSLEEGMEELYKKLHEHHFNKNDFEGDQFIRLKTLNKRLNLLKL